MTENPTGGRLAGRTLMMSGGSRGIGLAIGLAAAREGANVVLLAKTDVPDPRLPGTVHSAAAENGKPPRFTAMSASTIVPERTRWMRIVRASSACEKRAFHSTAVWNQMTFETKSESDRTASGSTRAVTLGGSQSMSVQDAMPSFSAWKAPSTPIDSGTSDAMPRVTSSSNQRSGTPAVL